RLADQHSTVAGHLLQAEAGRTDLHEVGGAVLRSGEGNVSAGPLHQRRMSEMRRQGSVRRRVRELQHIERTDRPHPPVLDSVWSDPGTEGVRTFLLPALRSEMRGIPAAMDATGFIWSSTASTGSLQQGPGMARPGRQGSWR